MARALRNIVVGMAKVAAVLLSLAVLAVALAIWFASPPSSQHARLAELPRAERTTLEAVLAACGLALGDLRDVGVGANPAHPRNACSIAIEGGHVRQLSLQGIGPRALPSLSAWRQLERLSLKGNGLTSLPEMEGCTALRELDASGNALSRLEAASFPAGLREVVLSNNPVEDLAPLAHLLAAERITVRQAKLTTIEPLIDLPQLRLLDVRENPIAALPARLPKAQGFRVDVEGCPVFTPPGYLRSWSFHISQGGLVGGRETQEGVVTGGAFMVRGTWERVPKLAMIILPTDFSIAATHRDSVELEATVESGRLRVYLKEAEETRGPWFTAGYVKGTGAVFYRAAMRYAEATPGHPARLSGQLEPFFQKVCFRIEPQGEEPVAKLVYRVWGE